jgi:PmbA protein
MVRRTSSLPKRWWVAVEWIEALIREGAKRVEEIEIYYVEGTSVSADLKRQHVSLCSSSRDCGLCIRTVIKGRIGSSSTNDPEQWRACLEAAIASGNLATSQTWEGLPYPAEVPGADLSFDPSLQVEPKLSRDLLSSLLAGAAKYPDAAITSGSAGLARGTVTLANSHGIRYTYRHTGISVSLEAITGQSTGYEFDHASFRDKVDPQSVGERAAFFASRSAGGKDIVTSEYDIILSPIAYADLLSNVFVPALSGRNVHQGRSRLEGKIGEAVTSPGISMFDDPHISRANGSAWWDAEGTPTRRVDFIRDGILEQFAYDLKTAYRFGKTTTGSAVRGGFTGIPSIGHHNFVVDGKREEIADERAVYVHSVVGAHTANPMSGDFSVEIGNPFWMEAGEFAAPIRSAMLAGNVFELHREIAGLGRESRAIGSYILPPIRVNKQHIIGK